ncbi:MAG: hypothetical protein DHS20C01_03990 [marine bacterium B5-7]|nr:MAG: hypothetical protein DHS20C01_03990 [marine bacterium B5-7]
MSSRRPRRVDANIIVIGAGSAGLVSAYIASALKADVILIEAAEMGGDCLNRGCVPSKALIAAARRAWHIRHADDYGISGGIVHIDFAAVMAHIRNAIDTIAPHDSVERYSKLGVRCIAGHARLVDPYTVAVDNQTYRARSIIIATGADPMIPPVPGLDTVDYLTSDTLWGLNELPRRLAVLGGGPIGCELSQALGRLGADVAIFEMQPRLLAGEDIDVSDRLMAQLTTEGVSLHTGSKVTAIEPGRLTYQTDNGNDGEYIFDSVLVATGRKPRVEGMGLEELGIELTSGRIDSNPFLQTRYPHIFACGDVVGPYQFTHAASHQAWHATVNALFRPFKRFRISYEHLPWAIYTDPEIGRVGLNENTANERDIKFECTRFDLSGLDRAVTDGETNGFVKILSKPGSDKILGATIVGHGAGEMVGAITLAMKHGIGLNRILGTILPYPTYNEALKRVAGIWKSDHAPEWALTLLRHYHQIRRRI